jgi:hypothetical protein
MSGSLGLTLITASQNQKEVTANAALVRLDNALTATFDANVTAGNITVERPPFRPDRWRNPEGLG